ncbi:protein phosphatase 2C [Actinobaculum sp. oral taxon 183 str. F0552]|uniref:PP2C family protein-serine/threonine phosphatase n=1 Tax=Actinobaculum sp. oral taxon 183 TaxID=712888 RepID=UPI0003981D88|nr:protein phosphatase 2C domain-containing protein [Actinobaculum sp. oral taxon 183]ERH20205.1 protein phosphatase 2C [Actinobaculum sp. oral taxon 183 str. F0552]
MGIQLRFAAYSDVGLVRSNNQDGGYASPNLLVLADGMGGAAAGDVASSVTVGHLAALDDDVYGADDLLPVLRKSVNEAHVDLVERAENDPNLAGMGTTCIALLRSSNKLAMVHIGDSRAYLLRDGKLTQVTHDHTLVQFLVDHGQLTPEEAEHHPKRNVIMRALGDTPGDVELDESVREAMPGDRWLLCSDGLFGVVAHETIEETLSRRNLNAAGEKLIELALAGGAPDNVTVVLAEVVDDSDTGSIQRSQQPIVVGSAAVDHRRPSRGGKSAAAKAAALPPASADSPDTGQSQDEAAAPEGAERRRSRVLPRVAVLFGVLAIIGAVLFGAYTWTQSRYYVASHNGRVTIYRGISQSLGPIKLSHIQEETDIKVGDLQPVARERLEANISRGSLEEARKVISNLREEMATPSTNPSTAPNAPAPAPGSPAPGSPAPSPTAAPGAAQAPDGAASNGAV